MIYTISHLTEYSYQQPVSLCHSKAWLRPKTMQGQTCHEVYYDIDPAPSVFHETHDFFQNLAAYFSIQQTHKKLRVRVRSRVEVIPRYHQMNIYGSLPWEQVLAHIPAVEKADVIQFALQSPFIKTDDSVWKYASRSFVPGRPVLEAVTDLVQRIYTEFRFVPGFSTVATPVQDILTHKKGVCQDFAHLAIACVRAVGLPARYVSGYLETLPPPGKEKLQGADASHAWFSIYVPQMGWVDFDPTNNMMPGEQHITVAWGREYSDVPPLKGIILSSSGHTLKVEVDVASVRPLSQ